MAQIIISAAILCESARAKSPLYPLKHEDWSDVIWRTCAVDLTWAGKRTTAADRAHFDAFIEEFDLGPDLFEAVGKMLNPDKPQNTTKTTTESSKSRGFADLPLHESWMPFSIMVTEFQRGRVLALTLNGFFGSLPSEAQAGDIVVVLFGGWVPFVLRPVEGDEFELVGACYLHGVMDGEWIRAGLAGLETGGFDMFREYVVR
jgi:hypothetical protein